MKSSSTLLIKTEIKGAFRRRYKTNLKFKHFEIVDGIQMVQVKVQRNEYIVILINLLIPCTAVEPRPTTYPKTLNNDHGNDGNFFRMNDGWYVKIERITLVRSGTCNQESIKNLADKRSTQKMCNQSSNVISILNLSQAKVW
jgi:hypothetical protein